MTSSNYSTSLTQVFDSGQKADYYLPGPTSKITSFCGKALNKIVFATGTFALYEGYLAPRAALPSVTNLTHRLAHFIADQKVPSFLESLVSPSILSETLENHAPLLDQTATISFNISYGLLGAITLCAGAFFLSQCCFKKNPYNEKDRLKFFGLQARHDLAHAYNSTGGDVEAALQQAKGFTKIHQEADNEAGKLIGSPDFKVSVGSLSKAYLQQK
jgi:hypothetical protein